MFKSFFMKIVNKITNIGGSLQTPIAILPAAGLLLALGVVFTNKSFLEMMPMVDNPTVHHIFSVALQCGAIIFGNLPLIFAAGVAIGLCDNDGVAALSAIVAYLIMNVTIGGLLGITPEIVTTSRAYVNMLGIPTLQTGVLGGIIIGVLVSSIYNRFFDIRLPKALEFFAGKRSVPIISAFSAFFVGVIMCVIWPPIQEQIDALSLFLQNSNGAVAGFMFGFVERLTIPFGMNHVWWPTFWLQAGEYVTQSGKIVHGDQLIFFAQLADNVPITSGRFMNGLFLLKMFSMPAVALAMYHCAKPENKAKVAGILMSGAITSFVCGITEPLEFCFIFTAPLLFFVYAIVTGMGFAVMNMIGVHLGLSFSGGLLDYVFFNVLPNRTSWWLLLPVGVIAFAVYYLMFIFAIRKFNYKTPGREDAVADEQENELGDMELINGIIKALGGAENIKHVNACYSRLRVDVKDTACVRKDEFQQHLKASGVSILGQNVQVIYGMKAVAIKEGVLAMLRGQTIVGDKISRVEGDINISTAPRKLQDMVSPYAGNIMPLAKVPDAVFSKKMVGDGFAIELTDSRVDAPVNATVISIFPTKHAISLLDENQNEILLHLGLNTVNLSGEGFEIFVTPGEKVMAGQLLAKVDLEVLRKNNLSAVSPIIFTNMDAQKLQVCNVRQGKVQRGDKKLFAIEAI